VGATAKFLPLCKAVLVNATRGDKRAAWGEWQHSSQIHGCPRQNPAYRCSAQPASRRAFAICDTIARM